MKNLLTAICCAISMTTAAQHTLVKDIAPANQGGKPVSFCMFNSKLYFLAHDGTAANGSVELWSHNSASGTTAMVADINPQTSSLPNYFLRKTCALGNDLYFTANDSVHGNELWKDDGSSPPVMANDIFPGTTGSDPDQLTILNGKLYFAATSDASLGREMHCYDPATGTVTMLKDIYPNNIGFGSSWSVVYNGKLYFDADDGSPSGSGLWEHDPIADTTIRITAGIQLNDLAMLYVFNNKLYFFGHEQNEGYELCVYDGSTISRVADLAPGFTSGVAASGTNQTDIIGFKNKLYFRGNGNAAGVQTVMCYDPATSSVAAPFSIGLTNSAEAFCVYANKIYYRCKLLMAPASELYRWDGISNAPVPADVTSGLTDPYNMIVYGQHMYLSSAHPATGIELYKFYDSDVNAVNTIKFTALVNVYPNPSSNIFSMDMNLQQPATFAVQVYDMAGRKVYDAGMHNYESGKHHLSVPAESLAPGNYTLHLRTDGGESFYTTQLVKQ